MSANYSLTHKHRDAKSELAAECLWWSFRSKFLDSVKFPLTSPSSDTIIVLQTVVTAMDKSDTGEY